MALPLWTAIGMMRRAAIALVVGAGLAFAGGAAAKSNHHPLRCRAGYVRRTVRVVVRVHGRIAHRRGKVVYTRVQRCVRVAKHKPPNHAPSPVGPTTTTHPSPPPPAASPPPSTVPVDTASPTDPVVVAVGDIARPPGCSPCEQSATAALAQTFHPDSVLVLGDNQYDSGLLSEYQGSYGLTWGRDFNTIVHPVPGNHEYAASSSAAGYFQYFGAAANQKGAPEGYYSFSLGTWHIVALNSDCSSSKCADSVGGTTSSAQTSWLQTDLAANRSACVLAMWHHPLFSSGWTQGSPGVAPLWTALSKANADVVLNGHDHLYERYAQQNPSGNATGTGIREFVAGTGGESLNGLSFTPQSTLQAYDTRDYGVLVLTLHAASYSWKFVNTAGATVDSGTTACHGPAAAPAAVAAVHATRLAPAARLTGSGLSFDVRPLRASRRSMMRTGIPVAVHSSRAVDVAVTIWLRHGRRRRRIASAYETESQIDQPYSRIVLGLPAHSLTHAAGSALVMRFAAVDAAGYRRTVTRTVALR